MTLSLSPGLPGLFKCHVPTIFPLTKWIGGSGDEDDTGLGIRLIKYRPGKPFKYRPRKPFKYRLVKPF